MLSLAHPATASAGSASSSRAKAGGKAGAESVTGPQLAPDRQLLERAWINAHKSNGDHALFKYTASVLAARARSTGDRPERVGAPASAQPAAFSGVVVIVGYNESHAARVCDGAMRCGVNSAVCACRLWAARPLCCAHYCVVGLGRSGCRFLPLVMHFVMVGRQGADPMAELASRLSAEGWLRHSGSVSLDSLGGVAASIIVIVKRCQEQCW